MSVADLVRQSEQIAEEMDGVVETIDSIENQAIADSAWYRLCSVNVMVRDEGGGAIAASIARSLLEQAAFWDWAAAFGVGGAHVGMWAALEYSGLRELADKIGDATWLGWVLPPGVEISAPAGPAIPRNASDAVKRLGHGLDRGALAPLQLTAVGAVHRMLGVLAHSNLVGAALVSDGGGRQLPERLAAIVVHVAATSASAVAASVATTDPRIGSLQTRARDLADAAAEIHGLEMDAPVKTQRPAKATRGTFLSVGSSIDRMPSASEDVTQAGLNFLEAADELTQLVLTRENQPRDGGALVAMRTYLLSLSHLDVFRGTLDGRLGRALLPFAARALLEEGTRWEWLQQSSATNPAGDSLRALVADSMTQRERIRSGLISDGVSADVISDLLGPAEEIELPALRSVSLPNLDDLLSMTYLNGSGVESARPMYALLTQFVHATPLSLLHIQRDILPSLSAPMWAVSVEAACRGFQRIAAVSILLADIKPEPLMPALSKIKVSADNAASVCTAYHFLG